MKIEKRKISVLMCVYNENEEWVKQSIESILKQSYKEFEFLIILDDPTNRKLKKIIEKYKEQDDRIKMHVNEKNIGLVKSLNWGLKYCRGEFIARIDADDIAMPRRIERQLCFLEKNTEYSLIGSDYMTIDEDDNIIKNSQRIICEFNMIKLALRYRNIMCHPSYMYRKDDIIEVGGYREIKYAEDFDLIIRLIMNGKKLCNLNEILLKYRVRNNGISKSNCTEQRLSSMLIKDNYKKNNYFFVDKRIEKNNKLKYRYYKDKVLFKMVEGLNSIVGR